MTLHAHQKPRVLISPLFQVTFIILTTIIISWSFYYRLAFFKAHDKLPQYQVITPAKFREFGAFANEINVGLYIDEYENFNLLDNDFTFTGKIWFSFDPGSISIDTLEKFSFAFGQVLSRSPVQTTLLNNKLIARYSIRVHHTSTLALENFPLDNHRIFIQLQNQYISPNEVIFSANLYNFIARTNSEIFGWIQRDLNVKSGYIEDKFDPFDEKRTTLYPTVLFILEFSRASIQQIITIFLPLLLIFYVILFAFSIKENSTSISLAAGSVTGILAYKFVIANLSPKVGYFMLSDYIFFLFLGTSILIFLVNISDIYYHTIPLLAKKIFLAGAHVCINIAIIFLLFK